MEWCNALLEVKNAWCLLCAPSHEKNKHGCGNGAETPVQEPSEHKVTLKIDDWIVGGWNTC